MEIIIHCSDSTWGNSLEIDKWHRQNGWNGIGYHFVILNGRPKSSKDYFDFMDGSIEMGREVSQDYTYIKKGAHTKGHNEKIGICLIGKSGDFTHDQYNSLECILFDIGGRLCIRGKDFIVKQHSDYDENKPYCAGIEKCRLDLLK